MHTGNFSVSKLPTMILISIRRTKPPSCDIYQRTQISVSYRVTMAMQCVMTTMDPHWVERTKYVDGGGGRCSFLDWVNNITQLGAYFSLQFHSRCVCVFHIAQRTRDTIYWDAVILTVLIFIQWTPHVDEQARYIQI